MAEEKICTVCEKNASTDVCSECETPLCDACTTKIKLKSGNLAEQSLNIGITSGVSLSTLRAGETTKKLCKKCLMEVDVDP
ncbi:MAG: hypothetical protein SVR08_02065 [Spirochaetota bacterium]|nr:hypothetical protein [Spirochaetota bacterium]